jgi:hypothetical protein
MADKPKPNDIVIWTVSDPGRQIESFELRTPASGLIERVDGTWSTALQKATIHAGRRRVDVWKQDRYSYTRVWTFATGG